MDGARFEILSFFWVFFLDEEGWKKRRKIYKGYGGRSGPSSLRFETRRRNSGARPAATGEYVFFFFWNRGNQRHSVSPRNLFLSNCRTKYLLSIGLSHSLTLFIYVYTPPSAFVSNFAVSCSGYLDIYLYTYISIKYVYISLSPLSLLFSKIVEDAPLTRPGFSGSIFK